MKKSLLERLYAIAVSAVFATAATVGVAVLMTESGEQARAEMSAAAVPSQVQPATPALTQWQAPAAPMAAKQIL